MASVNKVILLGNLGRDPETRYTTGGDAVTNLSIATSEQWKDKNGEKQERTEWHRVVLFGRQAEIAGEYQGELNVRSLVLLEKARVSGTLDAQSLVVREGGETGGAHPCPEVEQIPGAVADRCAQKDGIEAGAEAVRGLGNGQPAVEESIGCDDGAFANLFGVG